MTICSALSSHVDTMTKKKEKTFLAMRILRIYPQQLFCTSYSSVNYGHHAGHYTPSTYLLTTGLLYRLTTLLQFPPPPPCISGSHKSDLFFYKSVGGACCYFLDFTLRARQYFLSILNLLLYGKLMFIMFKVNYDRDIKFKTVCWPLIHPQLWLIKLRL